VQHGHRAAGWRSMPHSHGFLHHHLAHYFEHRFEVEALARTRIHLRCEGIQPFLDRLAADAGLSEAGKTASTAAARHVLG